MQISAESIRALPRYIDDIHGLAQTLGTFAKPNRDGVTLSGVPQSSPRTTNHAIVRCGFHRHAFRATNLVIVISRVQYGVRREKNDPACNLDPLSGASYLHETDDTRPGDFSAASHVSDPVMYPVSGTDD